MGILKVISALCIIALVVGYVLNIVALTHAVAITGFVALRIAGIFIPFIGAVTGWM